MPELPEVETVRRGLAPVLVGRTITRVIARRPDLRFPLPDRFAERLKGARVEALERRAKYLIAQISTGEALVMHLGMSGRFTIETPNARSTPGQYVYEMGTDPRHDHVVFELSGDARLVYNDPRRFGFMVMMPERDREAHALFRDLGAEPLSNVLNATEIARRARGRKTILKAFLMDQRNVAGLGNIYVSEALFRAGLSPKRRTATLAAPGGTPAPRAESLVHAIRSVLQDAIAAGGSTLRDYRNAEGGTGAFQETFAVYDREGENCKRPHCCGKIKRIVQSNRATFYCPRCQT